MRFGFGSADPNLLASQRPRKSSSRTCTPSGRPPARPPWRWSTASARQVPRGSTRALTLRVPSPLTQTLHLNRALKLPRALTRRHPAAPRRVLGPRRDGRAADRARRAPGTAERRRPQPVRSHLRGRRAPPRHARPQEDALCAQARAVELSRALTTLDPSRESHRQPRVRARGGGGSQKIKKA